MKKYVIMVGVMVVTMAAVHRVTPVRKIVIGA